MLTWPRRPLACTSGLLAAVRAAVVPRTWQQARSYPGRPWGRIMPIPVSSSSSLNLALPPPAVHISRRFAGTAAAHSAEDPHSPCEDFASPAAASDCEESLLQRTVASDSGESVAPSAGDARADGKATGPKHVLGRLGRITKLEHFQQALELLFSADKLWNSGGMQQRPRGGGGGGDMRSERSWCLKVSVLLTQGRRRARICAPCLRESLTINPPPAPPTHANRASDEGRSRTAGTLDALESMPRTVRIFPSDLSAPSTHTYIDRNALCWSGL